jgi:CheY-like chemotaxis protein
MSAAETPTIQPGQSNDRGVHIVIAEDNAITRRKIELAIAQLEWTFEPAVNGVEALDAAEWAGHSLCLLLADIDLPKITGIELAKALKAIPWLAAVPVVLMGWPDQESKARQPYCDAFVAKPFSTDTLLNCLDSKVDPNVKATIWTK